MTKKFAVLALGLLTSALLHAQLLYKVEGNGLEKPSYIFGTHHLAPSATIDSVAGGREALEGAEFIVGEVDVTAPQNEIMAAMLPYMQAPADSTISKLVSADRLAELDAKFARWSPMPGVTLDMMDEVKPMVVSAMVIRKMVQDEMEQVEGAPVDFYFQAEGVRLGKKIKAFETAQQQAEILYNSTPLSLQMKMLGELLDNPEENVDIARKMNNSYLARNLEALYELSQQEEDSPFMKRLCDDRNADWLTQLPGMMGEGSCFIAVGALHLPGATGVLEGLRRMGYRVTAVD